MCNCLDTAIINDTSIAIMDQWALFLTVIVTGISGSFTHCIGMCGPIAILQMSMRLMHAQEITSWTRIRASCALPYYFGKAATYAVLTMIIALLGQNILAPPIVHEVVNTGSSAIEPILDNTSSAPAYYLIRNFLLGTISVIFTFSGLRILFRELMGIINRRAQKQSIRNSASNQPLRIKRSSLITQLLSSFSFKINNIINFLQRLNSNFLGLTLFMRNFYQLIGKIKLKPFGLEGFFLGMILGLIPCGLVYSIIITIITNSAQISMSGIYAFIFGLMTIPGLLLVSYFGQYILVKWRVCFNLLYGISMFANAGLLLVHIA